MDNKDFETADQLIAKFLGGTASEEELQQLESWVQESEENSSYYRQVKNIWESSVELPVSTKKALTQTMGRIEGRKSNLTFWQLMQRIAAILFIPLFLASIWFTGATYLKQNSSSLTYVNAVAAFGTYSCIELPDGSKVWLNSGSSLRYPDKFTKKDRRVYLTGEAYFEVHSDKSSPFLVSTPYFTVKATGTRFNVMTELDGSMMSVTLVQGKVDVIKEVPGKKTTTLTQLKPNDHMIYDVQSGQVEIQTGDPYKYFAWKDGKLVFRNDNISEVARRISLQYNVDIEIKGDEIKQYRYRATFENEPLEELLRLLKISSPIDYTELQPKCLPDGSFSRRKIIIFSSNSNTRKP